MEFKDVKVGMLFAADKTDYKFFWSVSQKAGNNLIMFLEQYDRRDYSLDIVTLSKRQWEDRGLIWQDCFVIKILNKKKIMRELLND